MSTISFGQKKEKKTPDTYTFKETLLQSLAENDESLFLTLIPTKSDIDTALKYIEDGADRALNSADSIALSIRDHASDNFKALYKSGAINKIDWTMISEDSTGTELKKRKEINFPSLRFKYYFTHLGEHFCLSTSQLIYINNRWILFNNVRLKKMEEAGE